MIIYIVELSECYSGVYYTFSNGIHALEFVKAAMEHCTKDQQYTIHVENEEEKEATEE